MGSAVDQPESEVIRLIDQVRAGDQGALAALFDRYRDRLRRMVELRMDARLRSRLGASDILQEAYLDVARDLPAYVADPKLTPLLWLRLHVGRRLTTLHRKHLGTRMRDAGMEISMFVDSLPQPSSAALASMLLGRLTSPTQAAQRAERLLQVQEALNSLDPIDREVLALRHFEQLDRKDTIAILPGGWEGL
jgi:RNA polymerase sigma-70 factor, ECF subfamily